MDMTGRYLTFITFLVMLMLCCPFICNATPRTATYAGTYAQDLVWQGTVEITADVLILAGSSLTIRPGTEVRVVPAEGTQIDPEYLSPLTELLIRGRIDIQGTPDQPVRFIISERPDSGLYAWAGITLDNAANDSQIKYVYIERAEAAVRCVRSSPDILGNHISRCRYGMIFQENSHPNVIGNTFVDGEGGIFCWRGSSPTIKQNKLAGHDEEALFIDVSSQPLLRDNVIRDNEIGLALYRRDQTLNKNKIDNNHENIRWLGSQGMSR